MVYKRYGFGPRGGASLYRTLLSTPSPDISMSKKSRLLLTQKERKLVKKLEAHVELHKLYKAPAEEGEKYASPLHRDRRIDYHLHPPSFFLYVTKI